jgi:hypothetical protein
VTPLSPGRFGLQVTIDDETEDDLRYGQALLGHAIPSGDMAVVLKRLVREGIKSLERRKIGATDHPRRVHRRSAADGRYIAADVRRAVWKRDGGRCTFVSETGQRCPATRKLEFDHVDPYARDGASTVGNVRLLCRAHNQFEAERTYGAELMRHKREEAMRER